MEIAINNRPLAYLSEDHLDEPLTTFHLMYGHGYAKGRLNGRIVNVVPRYDVEKCKDRFLHFAEDIKRLLGSVQQRVLKRVTTNEHLTIESSRQAIHVILLSETWVDQGGRAGSSNAMDDR